jgi:choline-sulfatase
MVPVLLAGWLPSASWSKEADRPNFILIVIDALRPDFLGCYGYHLRTSPTIDELADSGVLFETAVSHAPWTKTSFSSIFTSLYPFQHGVIGWEHALPDSITTLAEILRARGYSTLAVINMLGLTGDSKVTKGFARISEANQRDRDAVATTDAAIELIRGSREPFFIVIHYFDTHWPYLHAPDIELEPSSGAQDTLREPGGEGMADQSAKAKSRYTAAIRHVDDSIRRLLAFLRQEGTLENSAIFITADHGDAFMEHGRSGHGNYLYDEEMRVPLIINFPQRYATPRRIGQQVRHIDLLPTIVELAGAADPGRREGVSLDQLARDGVRTPSRTSALQPGAKLLPADYTVCEVDLSRAPWSKCVRTDSWKLIVEPPTSDIQLYDLKNDPGEKVNLWGSGLAVGDTLLGLIKRVPGMSIRGWRLAFNGSTVRGELIATARVGKGGHITAVEAAAGESVLSFVLSADSSAMAVRISPQNLQMLIFDVDPVDSPVTIEFTGSGEGLPHLVHVGTDGERAMGQSFTLTSEDALGLPGTFRRDAGPHESEVFVWYLPGEPVHRVRKTVHLSTDERNRLKSLGYLH